MGDATLFGPLNYSMRIWLNPQQMTNYGFSAAGRHPGDREPERPGGGRPARGPPDHGQSADPVQLQTQGRLTTPAEFGNIILRTNPDGSVVRVRDVARVDLGAQTDGPQQPAQRRAERGVRHLSGAGRQRGRGCGTRPAGHWPSWRSASRPMLLTTSSMIRPISCMRRSTRSSAPSSKRSRWSSSWSSCSSATGARRSSRWSRCRCR